MKRTDKKQAIPTSVKNGVLFLSEYSDDFKALVGYVFSFNASRITKGKFLYSSECEKERTSFMAFYDFKTKTFTLN